MLCRLVAAAYCAVGEWQVCLGVGQRTESDTHVAFQLLNLTQLSAGLRRSWFKDDGIFWEVVGTSRSTSFSRISRPMCGLVF